MLNDNTNNILKFSTSYDTTGRFNVYKIVSQLNPVTVINAGSTSNQSIADQSSQVINELIRDGRQLVLVAENATSSPKERAEWEANVRRARGKVYSATVDGFRNQTGNLWAINELVQVIDDFSGINSRMLVNTVEFTLDPDVGRSTTISLVEKDAYTLTLDPPVKVDVLGKGLIDEVEDVEDILALLRDPVR